MIGPVLKRQIRRAYVQGIIDFVNSGTLNPGKCGDRRIDQAERRGFEDAKAGKALRYYEQDPERLSRLP